MEIYLTVIDNKYFYSQGMLRGEEVNVSHDLF